VSDLSIKIKLGNEDGLVQVLQLVELRVNTINKNISGTYRINRETTQGEVTSFGPTTPFLITNVSEVKFSPGELIKPPTTNKDGKITKEGIYAKGNEIKQEASFKYDEMIKSLAEKFDKKLEEHLKELVLPK
jgi:hypothetical protein